MTERSKLLEWLRGDLIGPGRPLTEPTKAMFNLDKEYIAPHDLSGPLVWDAEVDATGEEILYYDRESPHRKYGAGLLHPYIANAALPADQHALTSSDSLGADLTDDELDCSEESTTADDDYYGDEIDDFEISSPDIRHPSVIGISVALSVSNNSVIVVKLPRTRRFTWQEIHDKPFSINGCYELCQRLSTNPVDGVVFRSPMWRRLPAVTPDCEVRIPINTLRDRQVICKQVTLEPINLEIEVFPRIQRADSSWLLTIVLRNKTVVSDAVDPKERTLFQTYFEVHVEHGRMTRYPESQRPFDQLDNDEQSLALLYRDSATFGIGHGCSAGWEADPGQEPKFVYADVFPTVQLPSMTPDIHDHHGNKVSLSMRSLTKLNPSQQDKTWLDLLSVGVAYRSWINKKRSEVSNLDVDMCVIASQHLNKCEECLIRIEKGIDLLKNDPTILRAFQLTNLAMLLQQISTKQVAKRRLSWSKSQDRVIPEGPQESPWAIYATGRETVGVGTWRAFQVAFLLMSIEGIAVDNSPDREIVDLIWFPTGGGKTEAYLGVMAFYMFHQRIRQDEPPNMSRDGTNVLMRYTLRMLTTQQFQRAASLICSMEFLRRNTNLNHVCDIPGQRFSLGLWLGSDGSPNSVSDAQTRVNKYRSGQIDHNPLLVSECPWCRAEIGRLDSRPRGLTDQRWAAVRIKGVQVVKNQGPLLSCSDSDCTFGQESPDSWLPVEVIDERIYKNPPSLIIGTVDKFAIIAYRPEAGALFGLTTDESGLVRKNVPPGIVVQDELHLISGPLGTMYALYEGIFERFCTLDIPSRSLKPKIIASTATIRGASSQVQTLYARDQTSLFPPPGLEMGDSFFGTYARNQNGTLANGRLYLGIHASEYGSVLSAQVRTFSAALFRPTFFSADRRDPWWTLLAFYNSLRELGGAKTIFDSDIRSRLKFMFNRENINIGDRRSLRIVEELTSRLSQPAIVEMMDRLSDNCSSGRVVDACLASNIIEVGVDIDRLSIMSVVGQPKTTSTYIQVTGRVGRRWKERPGLVLTIYNPGKSRDRSHFEQFHSYHKRLYERVEPTTATPFAISTLERAFAGALIVWARQNSNSPVNHDHSYEKYITDAVEILTERSNFISLPLDHQRTVSEMKRITNNLMSKWASKPQSWQKFPQDIDGEYLMLWPGQFATPQQKKRGVQVPSSMRQVDSNARLLISPE
jgi:hypothetical protein